MVFAFVKGTGRDAIGAIGTALVIIGRYASFSISGGLSLLLLVSASGYAFASTGAYGSLAGSNPKTNRHAGSICRRTVLVLLSALVVLGVSSGSRTSPNFHLSPSERMSSISQQISEILSSTHEWTLSVRPYVSLAAPSALKCALGEYGISG
ncbi:hypothetical protein V6N11_014167 [Hibiscus sabdariffa]|uniref:Uncharacterized protein n=1 Tax=Hibiscus sabdariffa TaxID=183260 RepID=A0ABR2AGS9_9ROSI